MSRHRKTCKGTKKTLKSEIADLKAVIAAIGCSKSDAAEASSTSHTVTPPFQIETIGEIDAKNNQIYFFECGPAIKPTEHLEKGTLVKFGCTDSPYKRITTHLSDHAGGRLIDSVLTNNPKAVEADLKQYLKLSGRIIKCKTDKKKTYETEIFAVDSQEDYAKIVRKTVEFAEEYKNNVELLPIVQNRLKEATKELEALRITKLT